MSNEPIESERRRLMNDIGHQLDEILNHGKPPKTIGFVLLVFNIDKVNTPPGPTARMNYLSNASRADVVTALKELVANFEGRMMDAPETPQ